MTDPFTNGALAPALVATYFIIPRPVYELYDLETDPSELNNLSGKPDLAKVERDLRVALAEKMILDFDYLPLPAIPDAETRIRGDAPRASATSDRAAQFGRKDANKDGRLSFEEFGAGREPTEAKRWFELRDANSDGFVSREEFVLGSPLPKSR